MKACVFPGQGSQARGMGEGLFARYSETTAAADAILGYSVEELCLENPDKRLAQTRYTQPALYVVNALSYRSRCDSGAPPPDFVAGHSLGEYNALLAAGVFDFETGLRIVKRRGELMSGASGGGMAAVQGFDMQQVEEILRTNGLLSIDVANHNSPTQVVLAGPAEDIARAEDIFAGTGAIYNPLNVSAAFHSRYMEAFVKPLGEALREVDLQPPKIPVIANVSARPYGAGEARENLERQIREPVRWVESIRYLLDLGVDEFEEVGPGNVLTKLIKSIRKQVSVPASGKRTGSRERGGEDASPAITAERLGAESFRRDYNVRRAYVAGSMYGGIASKDLVVRMARAGYIGFFGAGGLEQPRIEENIRSIQNALAKGEPFGLNLLSSRDDPESEMAVVDLCLRHGVRFIEAAGYVVPSPALVRYRLKGLSPGEGGEPLSRHRVIVKVSRLEVAEAFLKPPPEAIVAELARAGLVSGEEVRLAGRVPMADDICVAADCGGHAGTAPTAVLLPAVIRLRSEIGRHHEHARVVRIGSAGGIGTPAAAAAAFLLGADFVLTGSINQCTVEAGTSEDVKDLLQAVDVQGTECAPAGDLFELGGRIQVLKRGVSFPARANRLHDLWRHHGSWEEIEAQTRARIEGDYFGRSFGSIYEELKARCAEAEIERAEGDRKHRMALVFRWYFDHTMRLAMSGASGQRPNYQVHCGPALGAFNQWVKGTPLEPWRSRHADVIADRIMEGAAEILRNPLHGFAVPAEPDRS